MRKAIKSIENNEKPVIDNKYKYIITIDGEFYIEDTLEEAKTFIEETAVDIINDDSTVRIYKVLRSYEAEIAVNIKSIY